jgi:hypothetical protein
MLVFLFGSTMESPVESLTVLLKDGILAFALKLRSFPLGICSVVDCMVVVFPVP